MLKNNEIKNTFSGFFILMNDLRLLIVFSYVLVREKQFVLYKECRDIAKL